MKQKRKEPRLPYAVELQLRRQAEIQAEAERRAVTALKCGCVALNDTEGLGFARLTRFALHLKELIDEYYADPELGEMRLNRRCEQLGFLIGKHGELLADVDGEGVPVRAMPELPEVRG